MNKNLDLTEILKDAPKGTKLWSPIYGDCTLKNIIDKERYPHSNYPIVCESVDEYGNKDVVNFTEYGLAISRYPNGECVLFPSKENRDWETFKAPNTHKHFEPFQKVLRSIGHEFGYEVWFADFYSHYDDSTREHYLASGYVVDDDEIVPFEGNEDKLGQTSK